MNNEKHIANSLTIARGLATPYLTNRLLEKQPEERTWQDTFVSSVISSTDFLDGKTARKYDVTKFGAVADQSIDKINVLSQQIALAKNREIPLAHPALKIVRDLAVTGLRLYASANNKEIPVGSLGKQKTTAELLTVTVAHSPFAKNKDLLRRGSSVSTALSLMSGAQYFKDLKKSKNETKETDSARNSDARKIASGPMSILAEKIDRNFPKIQPDHLTLLGLGMVVGANIAILKNPNKTLVPTTVYTIGSLIDGLDGSLARLKAKESNQKTSTRGMLFDLWADKLQEVLTMSTLSHTARKRQNNVSADNYKIAAISTPLSALTRAYAESLGYVVSEGGMGTRVTRGILGGVGMALNKHQDVSDIISVSIASGNVITSSQRLSVGLLGEKSEHVRGKNTSEDFKNAGKIKYKSLIPLALASLATSALLLRKK